MTKDAPPDFILRHVRAKTDEDAWRDIDQLFDEYSSLVATLHIETKEQAIGVKDGKIYRSLAEEREDPALGRNIKVRDWDLAPFIPNFDQQNLNDMLERARELVEAIAPKIAAREISPQLMHDWGLFCSFACTLSEISIAEQSNMGAHRAGRAGGDAQRRDKMDLCASHYIVNRTNHLKSLNFNSKRTRVDHDLQQYILEIVASETALPEGGNIEFFAKMLSKEHKSDVSQLSGRYREKKLSKTKAESLIEKIGDDIPILDFRYPTPKG